MPPKIDGSWDLELSIIIPVKDEEENIDRLAGEICAAMAPVAYAWECIWVDDGSTDATLSELAKLNNQDPRHQFIALTRNFGQSAALHVGFDCARGRLLGTLDGDGQNDPRDLPAAVAHLIETGADMVTGVRQERQDTLVRKISSRIGNGFRNWLTGENIADVGCSLRVFKHACTRNILSFKGMHRFLPTLIRIGGFSHVVEMPVNHRPRKFGKTKYGINNRMWVGIMDTLAVRWMQSRVLSADIEYASFLQPEYKEDDSK